MPNMIELFLTQDVLYLFFFMNKSSLLIIKNNNNNNLTIRNTLDLTCEDIVQLGIL